MILQHKDCVSYRAYSGQRYNGKAVASTGQKLHTGAILRMEYDADKGTVTFLTKQNPAAQFEVSPAMSLPSLPVSLN